jgi:hypothetical protein
MVFSRVCIAVFLLLLESRGVCGLWDNTQAVESNLDHTIQAIENRITATETAYRSVIEANDHKSQIEINSYKESVASSIAAYKEYSENRIKANEYNVAKLSTDIGKLDGKLDAVNVFKIQANGVWTILVFVFGSFATLVFQNIAAGRCGVRGGS